jgi:O-antigen/teichoic acid export membrane protein
MSLNNPLFRSIFHLLGINGIGYVFLLLISIIIFRTVDKSYYGLYVIMISLFAFVELLMAGFNESIIRFLKDKIPLNEKQNIVFFVLLYKYLIILLFVIFIYLSKYYGLFNYLIGNYGEVSDVIDSYLLVVILNGILSTFIGVNNSILNSQLRYKLAANIGLMRHLVFFSIVLVLSFYTKNYLHYLYASLFVSAVMLLYLIIRIVKDFNEFSFIRIIQSKFKFEIVKKYVFPYSTPLTGSSLLTYVKNYLPLLILGKEFSLENVAVFSILKTFYKALHSLTSSFIDPMMSKFIELKDQSKDYVNNIRTIFWSMLLLRLVIFAFLALTLSYIFIIYNLDNTKVNQFIFYVLGFEFIIAGMILVYGIILRLEKSTYKIFQISISRFCIELTLIYLILFDYGLMAAALILLISRYVETIAMYLFVRRTKIFNFSGVILTCFLVIVISSILKLKLIY